MDRIRSPLAALCFVAASSPAFADTRIDYRVEGGDAAVESVLIGQGGVRVDQRGGRWLLYDQASATMSYVDGPGRQYMQFSKATLERQRRLLDATSRFIDEQWPEVIAHMQRMDRNPALRNPGKTAREHLPGVVRILRAHGAAEEDLPTQAQLEEIYATYDSIEAAGGWEPHLREITRQHYRWMLDNTGSFQVKKAGSRSVEGRTCRLTEVSLAMKALPRPTRIIDYCTLAPDALPLPPAERKVLDGFRAASEAIVGTADRIRVVPVAIAKDLDLESTAALGVDQITMDGIPVRSQVYGPGGRPGTTSTLAKVDADARLAADDFRIPQDYRRNDPESDLQKALDGAIAMVAAIEAASAETGRVP